MQVSNSGTVSVRGTAILRVEDGSGGAIQTFQQEFGGLAAEGSFPFDATWDTTGIEPGLYRLIGYALYKGENTSPAILTLHTATRIYQPLVLKSH